VFGTAVTERTHALDGDLANISLVNTTPVPTYVKELDNALRLVVQAGLSSTEDRILTNYSRRPQVAAKFAVGDFVSSQTLVLLHSGLANSRRIIAALYLSSPTMVVTCIKYRTSSKKKIISTCMPSIWYTLQSRIYLHRAKSRA